MAIGGLGVADAATGGALQLGHKNSSSKTTTLKDSHGTPLALVGKKSKPPLKVNSSKQVAHLNAEYVGGKTASQFEGKTVTRIGSLSGGEGTVKCPSGDHALGGGVIPDPTGADDLPFIVASVTNFSKSDQPNGWFGVVSDNDDTYGGGGSIVVSCTSGPSSVSGAVARAAEREKLQVLKSASQHKDK